MKKALKIVAIVIILGTSGYWCTSYYKNSASLQGVIHKDATAVFKIGVNSIKETIVLDALSSPGYYYNNSTFKKSNKEKETKDPGIDLQPYNMVGFMVPEVSNTLFSVLKIDSSSDFKIFINDFAKEKGIQITSLENGAYSYFKLNKIGIICAWNSKKLVTSIATKNSLEAVQGVFSDVLINNYIIQEKNNFWIEKLRTAKDHIVFFDKEGKVVINFQDDEAVIQGSFNVKEIFPKEVSVVKTPNSSVEMHLDANFARKENKMHFIKALSSVSFFEKTNLNVTELANRTNGFFSIAMSGTTVQADSIITYSYDDNFNKIPQVTLQEKEVPKLSFILGKEGESLLTYFQKQGAVSKKVFTALPYYQFYTEENSAYTSLKTEQNLVEKKNIKSPYFFKAKIDFKQIERDINFPNFSSYLGLFSILNCTAKQEKEGVVLDGTIFGKNKDINIISQLTFGINNLEEQ